MSQLSLLMSPALDALPPTMREASARLDGPDAATPTCSWCGLQQGRRLRPDSQWRAGFESIAWAGAITAERVCPCCPIEPTCPWRAVEVAAAMEAAHA